MNNNPKFDWDSINEEVKKHGIKYKLKTAVLPGFEWMLKEDGTLDNDKKDWFEGLNEQEKGFISNLSETQHFMKYGKIKNSVCGIDDTLVMNGNSISKEEIDNYKLSFESHSETMSEEMIELQKKYFSLNNSVNIYFDDEVNDISNESKSKIQKLREKYYSLNKN